MSYSKRSRYSASLSPSPVRRYRSLSRSVSRSRSRSRSSSVENPGNNLYVTGLSTRVTKREIEKHFSSEGKVEDVHLVVDPWTRESRGFAFVTMSRLADADRCIKYLDRSVLEGRVITVEKAKRRRGRTPTPGRYLGLKAVHVRRRSPSYSSHSRSLSPSYSSERGRSSSRSVSPYSRRRRSRSWSRSSSPRYSRGRGRSYSRSRSRSPYRRYPVSWRDRDYSPYSPEERYHRRSRYRCVSPRVRRVSRRGYSPSVSPGPRRGRSYYSVSRSPPRRSRRSYSRSVSPVYRRRRSRRSYSRSVSPVYRRRRSRSRSMSPRWRRSRGGKYSPDSASSWSEISSMWRRSRSISSYASSRSTSPLSGR